MLSKKLRYLCMRKIKVYIYICGAIVGTSHSTTNSDQWIELGIVSFSYQFLLSKIVNLKFHSRNSHVKVMRYKLKYLKKKWN